ncbi:MAG: hypothetical protein LBC70_09880 [Chitinispirillales bacterium]|nr:hypothetical protein [Chitinispirillales bacterium]
MQIFKKGFLLGLAMAVAGLMVFSMCIYFDGDAQVRFTWDPTLERDHILHVSASYDDVKMWYNEVYLDFVGVDDYDFTDMPKYSGSTRISNNVFSSTTGGSRRNQWFRVNMGPDNGWYTAVAGVKDFRFGEWYFEIVANYRVQINPATDDADGTDRYFEVVFEIEEFLEGEIDDGWFQEELAGRNVTPAFRKARAETKQIVKAGGILDVEYYVIRRPMPERFR